MMTSHYPYLIRAFYQWMIDNLCTPIVLLNASQLKCAIPKEYINNNEIAFNISPQAIHDLKITNESMTFQASFSGIIYMIAAPINSVLAIYAEENEKGLFVENNTVIISDENIHPTATHRAPDLTLIETHHQITTEESP